MSNISMARKRKPVRLKLNHRLSFNSTFSIIKYIPKKNKKKIINILCKNYPSYAHNITVITTKDSKFPIHSIIIEFKDPNRTEILFPNNYLLYELKTAPHKHNLTKESIYQSCVLSHNELDIFFDNKNKFIPFKLEIYEKILLGSELNISFNAGPIEFEVLAMELSSKNIGRVVKWINENNEFFHASICHNVDNTNVKEKCILVTNMRDTNSYSSSIIIKIGEIVTKKITSKHPSIGPFGGTCYYNFIMGRDCPSFGNFNIMKHLQPGMNHKLFDSIFYSTEKSDKQEFPKNKNI